MSSLHLRPRHRFLSSATLLTFGAYVALMLFAVWAIVGFIAAP